MKRRTMTIALIFALLLGAFVWLGLPATLTALGL
ncbi:MAG: hypothetical protein RIR45_1127, partial [Pseudomonadota bacterium]